MAPDAESAACASVVIEANPQSEIALSSSPPSIHNNYRQNNTPSKLPAFRFADLQKESLGLPSLLHTSNNGHQFHAVPPSPVSPKTDLADENQPNNTPDNDNIALKYQLHDNHTNNYINNRHPVSPDQSPVRSRALTFLVKPIPTATSNRYVKRSASLDSSPTAIKGEGTRVKRSFELPTDSTTTTATTVVDFRQQQLRSAPATSSANDTSSPSSAQNSQRVVDEVIKEWAQGQRELLLPKTVQRTAALDEKKNSASRRPPVSYKPPASTTGASTSIPPIRSFRSSGSRRSLVLDMNSRTTRGYEGADDGDDSSHRDRTLRALEGRREDDVVQQMTPPDSATDRPEPGADDHGDVFMKLAREDSENQSAVSRVVRSSHRRPLSAAVPSYKSTSPPQVSRRLSDQETSRSRTFGDDQSAERMARTLTYRGLAKEKQSDETKAKAVGAPLRPSPLTPRSIVFQDGPEGAPAYKRRRPSIADRTHLKQASRAYNSSPLVPKSMEPQQPGEGTESTASTAAPSTVWDELDDLKSRIHRLELTGKLPPTSGAAMSRASDERPPTATTNATTMSGSPKRASGSGVQADVASTTSSHKEGQPLLQSALNKSKPFLATDIYNILETAATDAMALSTMIGPAGQPGPISSGASTIGGGATVTDRQLRRKADSICRSLTELCLALSESAAESQAKQPQEQPRPQQVMISAPAPEPELVTSPTMTKFMGFTAQRRPSVSLAAPSLVTSPRALSRLEERRSSMLMSSALPSPNVRYSNVPPTPTENANRKSSLMIARTRRAQTEEPEEQNGRKSSLLRTRRAGTEEPEEAPSGRKSSLLRTRRGTVDYIDETETRFRPPIRLSTEIAPTRTSGAREYTSQVPMPSIESSPPVPAISALPRRRVPSTMLNTRLIQPSTPTMASATRRYFDKATPDREMNSLVDKLADDRGQRQFSLTQSILGRSGSLKKRAARESMIPSSSLSTAQAAVHR